MIRLKADKPIHIKLEIEPETLTMVADRTHFSNIISNLASTAVPSIGRDTHLGVYLVAASTVSLIC